MQNVSRDDDRAVNTFNSYLKTITIFGGKTIDCVPNIVKLRRETTDNDRDKD
jgi:hypothetical protein